MDIKITIELGGFDGLKRLNTYEYVDKPIIPDKEDLVEINQKIYRVTNRIFIFNHSNNYQVIKIIVQEHPYVIS